jgi:hypothetical protein
MQPSTSRKKCVTGPKRRGRQDRDEGLDEAPQLLDDEPADMKQANPVEENESAENESVDDIEESGSPY